MKKEKEKEIADDEKEPNTLLEDLKKFTQNVNDNEV